MVEGHFYRPIRHHIKYSSAPGNDMCQYIFTDTLSRTYAAKLIAVLYSKFSLLSAVVRIDAYNVMHIT